MPEIDYKKTDIMGLGKSNVTIKYVPDVTENGTIYNMPLDTKSNEPLPDMKVRDELGKSFDFAIQ